MISYLSIGEGRVILKWTSPKCQWPKISRSYPRRMDTELANSRNSKGGRPPSRWWNPGGLYGRADRDGGTPRQRNSRDYIALIGAFDYGLGKDGRRKAGVGFGSSRGPFRHCQWFSTSWKMSGFTVPQFMSKEFGLKWDREEQKLVWGIGRIHHTTV